MLVVVGGHWEAYRGVIEQYTQTEAAKSAKASLDRISASTRIQVVLM